MFPELPVVLGERGPVHVCVDYDSISGCLDLTILHDCSDGKAHVTYAQYEELSVVLDAIRIQSKNELVQGSKCCDCQRERRHIGDWHLVCNRVDPV